MLTSIREAFRTRQYRVGLHAHLRHLERGIRLSNLVEAIGLDSPELIEDYADDPRGPSCLILGWVADRGLHVVVSATAPHVVITAYWPDPNRWTDDLRQRKEHHL